MEWLIFAAVVRTPSGKIHAPATEQVERCPLLRDADRVMKR
jgi:hypothetical protein